MGELHFTIWHVFNEQYGSRIGIFNSSCALVFFLFLLVFLMKHNYLCQKIKSKGQQSTV